MVELSVVVATQGTTLQLRRCLTALVEQPIQDQMEILVVDGSGQPETGRLALEFPSVRVVHPEGLSNVPALWTAGILAARGRIVALTIENCVPAPDWAQKMIDAQSDSHSAVSGALEMDPSGGLMDWAIYFCRYSAHMLPFQPRLLNDLPADNISYKSGVLREVEHLAVDGFWETLIHEDMRRRDCQLLSTPGPIVTFAGGIGAWRFFRRRFLHGRYFAARRAQHFSAAQRGLRAAGFPAVAALLLFRIALRVWRNGRHRARLLVVLPVMGVFVLGWAAGEGAGYLDSRAANTPPSD